MKPNTDQFWMARISSFLKYSKLRCKNAEKTIGSLVELPTDPWISEDNVLKISKFFKHAFKEI